MDQGSMGQGTRKPYRSLLILLYRLLLFTSPLSRLGTCLAHLLRSSSVGLFLRTVGKPLPMGDKGRIVRGIHRVGVGRSCLASLFPLANRIPVRSGTYLCTPTSLRWECVSCFYG